MATKAKETRLTVDAFEGGIPVTSMDASGKPVKTGKIIYRDYEKDRSLRSVHFVGNQGGRTLSFGKTSGQYEFVNPYDFVRPLLDAGFEPRLHHPYNGGAALFAMFAHPEIEFPDLIGWDLEQHGGSGAGMNLAVLANANIRPGYLPSLVAGFFRQVCTNGLITKWLGLGEFRLGGRKDMASVPEWIEGRYRVLEGFSAERRSTRALGWPVGIMKELFDKDAGDPREFLSQQPVFVRQSLATMASLPKYAKGGLVENLEKLSGEEDMCQLDLLNAITNTAIKRTDEGTETRWPIYRNLDLTHGALSMLVEAGAFKAGVEGFGNV